MAIDASFRQRSFSDFVALRAAPVVKNMQDQTSKSMSETGRNCFASVMRSVLEQKGLSTDFIFSVDENGAVKVSDAVDQKDEIEATLRANAQLNVVYNAFSPQGLDASYMEGEEMISVNVGFSADRTNPYMSRPVRDARSLPKESSFHQAMIAAYPSGLAQEKSNTTSVPPITERGVITPEDVEEIRRLSEHSRNQYAAKLFIHGELPKTVEDASEGFNRSLADFESDFGGALNEAGIEVPVVVAAGGQFILPLTGRKLVHDPLTGVITGMEPPVQSMEDAGKRFRENIDMAQYFEELNTITQRYSIDQLSRTNEEFHSAYNSDPASAVTRYFSDLAAIMCDYQITVNPR